MPVNIFIFQMVITPKLFIPLFLNLKGGNFAYLRPGSGTKCFTRHGSACAALSDSF
jgi:hypothetical protein